MKTQLDLEPLRDAIRVYLGAGHTQCDLSEASGVERTTITKFLGGWYADLSLSTAVKLAAILGFSLDELVRRNGNGNRVCERTR